MVFYSVCDVFVDKTTEGTEPTETFSSVFSVISVVSISYVLLESALGGGRPMRAQE
jgi:hypothetical protein